MRWLFAVFILSLCALLWAAMAIARHIRREAQGEPGTQPAVAAHEQTQPVLQRKVR
jgi:hypothetical protein